MIAGKGKGKGKGKEIGADRQTPLLGGAGHILSRVRGEGESYDDATDMNMMPRPPRTSLAEMKG